MKPPSGQKVQRFRVRSTRGKRLSFISHLDLMRLWERALRRAGLPLAYSQGFSPHPQLSMAAPLPLGITSEGELMDIFLDRWIPPYTFTEALKRQLPHGIEILEAHTVPVTIPSLQSQVRLAEYRAELETTMDTPEIEKAIHAFMKAENIPWQRVKDTSTHTYNLRALVDKLWIMSKEHSILTLGMVLRCDPSGTGRPEQVTAALGFASFRSIHRTRLILQAPR